MKAAVISQGSLSSKWTIDAMKEYFDEVDDINIKHIEINFSGNKAQILYKGEALPKYDCIFCKGSFRYANLLKTFTILINGDSFMPIHPDAFTICHDKLLTQLELQKANIPMPTTYMASTIEAARSILERLNYPIIMKFPQGTQGKGVLFAESYASASSILDALSSLRQPFLIQEYIETGGTDVRAFVVGDRVVAAYQRKANVKEKRANIHAGGVGEQILLDDATIRMVIKAAKSVGAQICGVDVLISHKGPVVIEINSSPGLQGVTKYTGINVAEKIAKFLFDKTKEFKSNDTHVKATEVLSVIESVDKEQKIIMNPDFRGSRILLPEVISKIAALKEDGDYEFRAKKGEIHIKEFNM